MSFRSEHKVRLTSTEQLFLKQRLIAKGMTALHPEREIASVYFDSRHFGMYHDAEEGCVPRRKVRIRRYPGVSDNQKLEVKISAIDGRFKTIEDLTASCAQRLTSQGYLDSLYGICMPVVEVCYQRQYFFLKGIRITFDKDIRYSKYNDLTKKIDSEVVVEFKCPVNVSMEMLRDELDISFTRFSKYSRAVLKTCQI